MTAPVQATTPVTLGVLESGFVAFGGAFVGGLATGLDVLHSAIIGGVAFFGVLGYSGYQAYNSS